VTSLHRILAGAALVAAVSGCAGEGGPVVTVHDNSIVAGNFDFIHEHWTEENLRALQREEDFSTLQAASQFDLFLKGCDWTHRQWEEGRPDPYPLCNARAILQDIRSGKTGGFCAQYAYVLADVLKASGFFSVRYVEIVRADGEGHFVVESWSDEFRKWVVLDPYHNVWFRYVDSGEPAGALEIRDSLFGGTPVEAVAVDGGGPVDTPPLAAFYRNVAVSLRSDLMRHSRPLSTRDRLGTFLFFRDARSGAPYEEGIPYENVTERVEDINYDRNRARVEYLVEEDSIAFSFHTDGTMANFREFMIRKSSAGNWEPSPSTITLDRADGVDSFAVMPVNQYNRDGVPTKVEIRW